MNHHLLRYLLYACLTSLTTHSFSAPFRTPEGGVEIIKLKEIDIIQRFINDLDELMFDRSSDENHKIDGIYKNLNFYFHSTKLLEHYSNTMCSSSSETKQAYIIAMELIWAHVGGQPWRQIRDILWEKSDKQGGRTWENTKNQIMETTRSLVGSEPWLQTKKIIYSNLSADVRGHTWVLLREQLRQKGWNEKERYVKLKLSEFIGALQPEELENGRLPHALRLPVMYSASIYLFGLVYSLIDNNDMIAEVVKVLDHKQVDFDLVVFGDIAEPSQTFIENYKSQHQNRPFEKDKIITLKMARLFSIFNPKLTNL